MAMVFAPDLRQRASLQSHSLRGGSPGAFCLADVRAQARTLQTDPLPDLRPI